MREVKVTLGKEMRHCAAQMGHEWGIVLLSIFIHVAVQERVLQVLVLGATPHLFFIGHWGISMPAAVTFGKFVYLKKTTKPTNQ